MVRSRPACPTTTTPREESCAASTSTPSARSALLRTSAYRASTRGRPLRPQRPRGRGQQRLDAQRRLGQVLAHLAPDPEAAFEYLGRLPCPPQGTGEHPVGIEPLPWAEQGPGRRPPGQILGLDQAQGRKPAVQTRATVGLPLGHRVADQKDAHRPGSSAHHSSRRQTSLDVPADAFVLNRDDSPCQRLRTSTARACPGEYRTRVDRGATVAVRPHAGFGEALLDALPGRPHPRRPPRIRTPRAGPPRRPHRIPRTARGRAGSRSPRAGGLVRGAGRRLQGIARLAEAPLRAESVDLQVDAECVTRPPRWPPGACHAAPPPGRSCAARPPHQPARDRR